MKFRCRPDGVKTLFWSGVGWKMNPRIKLTSAKDEVEAQLGNKTSLKH